MEVSIDLKCSVTTAILSVLIFLLLVNLMGRVWAPDSVGKDLNNSDYWFKSFEVVMLVSVFLAFNLNNHLFSSCKSS